ncbi:hypothetical protein B0I35DRAFT_359877 [Stachybotrys elegans]|uniref:Transcription factor RfeG n=1 Tax=Stachybotrys elegans TaxID=80388 RepID=A0A8K0WMQ1_9HYPO|nr:hypothetical protein B0I35DRAFT_359877 [Stachybotrys elegans]
MSRQPRNQGAPVPTTTTRQNEYFVPRDGIDREVISADICRYLGNDALVRPGHYEVSRHCSCAMIEDLKADSARWDSERRAQTSRNAPGGINTSRDATGVPARHTSNSPLVQYRYSETHQSRQHHGPTDNAYPSDPYARDAGYDGPRYPGSGAPGYTGAMGSYPQAQQQQSYGSGSGSYAGYQQSHQSPPPDPRYAPPQAASMYQGSSDSPYLAAGTNMPVGYAAPNDPYGASRTGSSAAGAQQPVYATANPSQQAYPAQPSYPYGSSQVPSSNSQAYANVQPHDPFYGRGAYNKKK